MPKKHHLFFVAGGLPQKMHRIVTTKRNTQQKKPLKFPEVSAVLIFSHVFFLMPHIPCLPPKNSWLTDLDLSFLRSRNWLQKQKCKSRRRFFFSGVGVTTLGQDWPIDPEKLVVWGWKKIPSFFWGGFPVGKNYTTQLYLVKFEGYSS